MQSDAEDCLQDRVIKNSAVSMRYFKPRKFSEMDDGETSKERAGEVESDCCFDVS